MGERISLHISVKSRLIDGYLHTEKVKDEGYLCVDDRLHCSVPRISIEDCLHFLLLERLET